jgi:hypothetical protein
MLSRAFASGVGQAAATASSVVLMIFVARTSTPETFGAFGIAYTVFVFVLGCSRALSSEVLLVSRLDRLKSAFPAAVPLQVTAIACIAAGGVVGLVRSPSDPVVWLFLGGALVVLADHGRYWASSELIAGRGALADGLSLAVQIALCLVLDFAGFRSSSLFVVVWGLCAGIRIMVLRDAGFLEKGSYFARSLFSWLGESRSLTLGFLGDFVLLNLASLLSQAVLVMTHGQAAAASVRGSQLLFGPVTVLVGSVSLFLLPRLSRESVEPRAAISSLLSVSAGLSVFAVAWTLVLTRIPFRVGNAVTGSSWPIVEGVLWEAGLYSVAGALATGGVLGLRALRLSHTLFAVRLIVAPCITVAACIGAFVGSGRGLLLASGMATLVSAAIWWGSYLRVVHRPIA